MERGRGGKRSVCSDFNDTVRHGSEFWLMVLRLHAPLAFQRRHKRPPASFLSPLSLYSCAFSLSLLFPIYAGIFFPLFFFAIHLDLSVTASLFRMTLLSHPFFPFPFFFSAYLSSLSFYLSRQITLLAVMSSMKHYTRQCHSSRRGPPRERCGCAFPDACTPQNRRNTSDYAECLYMQICDGESCIRRII